ncbi:hypothetical protein PR048_031083 [Dryococelus australis]|uniref:Uncharacterized protein n=1 Tax=Dryococelus australis TaxID=614101 RepID=A0ABQ9G8D7_9NEOP|nr:hypothetical protein PR048_031083 [Dryococelus australis]
MNGRAKRKISKKTRLQTASSGHDSRSDPVGDRTRIAQQLAHTVFDTSWRTLAQSSPSTVTADNQCAADIGIFVHKYVESSLQVIELTNYSVVRLLANHPGEQGSILGGVAPGFSHVGLVPDDAAGWRVFPESSRFRHPCIPPLLDTHPTSPSSALKTSVLGAAQISPLRQSIYRLFAIK